MEDYKILIYLVLSILYFLFKGRGKKKKPVTRTNSQPQVDDQNPEQRRKPKSFEELLAELSGESQQKDPSYDSDDEILQDKENIKPLSEQVDERPMHQKVSQEDYENADQTLKELYKKGEKLKSIDELVDIEEVALQSNRFKEFEDEKEENSFAREIREGLSDPESAKKAIVYAEILNRKY